ncbi:MAG: hypothetical protein COV75_05580 [Candidatus Omnitrophica bacterium CG11_big_fil_rev_8_21_14_0_20_63_9]|nr:MAG: hypothetical protein COV75_05580 [Candidatus Omnitrophica bacterium CG11_big_fil_rev_8_21_14_0_20_63_9]
MNATAEVFRELGFDPAKVKQPEAAVIYALARTCGLALRRLSAAYRRFGLSAPAFNLLLLLERGLNREGCSQREAGNRLVVSASDMSGLVDRLERRGLVRRQDGRDRRSYRLQLTPKGSALVAEVWPHHAEVIGEMTATLTARDRDVLLGALGRLRQVIER